MDLKKWSIIGVIAGLLISLLLGIGTDAWVSTVVRDGLMQDRLNAVSGLMVQIDSFLVGGYAVGLFFYLAELARGFRYVRRVVYGWAFVSKKASDYFEQNKKKWNEISHFGIRNFVIVVLPLVFYLASALFAIAASGAASSSYERYSIESLVLGFALMMGCLVLLEHVTDNLSKFVDILAAVKGLAE